MKNIRQSVFETNSSSTHSISISEINSDDLMDNSLIPDIDGKLFFDGGEFGWQWEKFNDALTKANYLVEALSTFLEWKQSNLNHFDDSFKESFGYKAINLYDSFYKKFENVIKNQTKCDDIVFIKREYGHIDHDSLEDEKSPAFKILSSDEETIRQFIFNKKSWLFLGNDNDFAPNKFYDVEEGIVYTHKLVAKYKEREFYWEFKKFPDLQELKYSLYAILRIIHEYDEEYDYSSKEIRQITLETKQIHLHRNDLFHKARNLCPQELHDIFWDKIHPKYKKSGYDWTCDKEEELKKLPENNITLIYDIVKI